MYNCPRHKAHYRSSVSVLCILVMLLVMLSILDASRLRHPQTNPNLPSFDQLRPVSSSAYMSDCGVTFFSLYDVERNKLCDIGGYFVQTYGQISIKTIPFWHHTNEFYQYIWNWFYLSHYWHFSIKIFLFLKQSYPYWACCFEENSIVLFT